jgi:hypothetical protein
MEIFMEELPDAPTDPPDADQGPVDVGGAAEDRVCPADMPVPEKRSPVCIMNHHPSTSDALDEELEGLALDEIRYAVSVQQEPAFHRVGNVDVQWSFICI